MPEINDEERADAALALAHWDHALHLLEEAARAVLEGLPDDAPDVIRIEAIARAMRREAPPDLHLVFRGLAHCLYQRVTGEGDPRAGRCHCPRDPDDDADPGDPISTCPVHGWRP